MSKQLQVTLYGADWCPDCRRVKYILGRHKIDYEYKVVDDDKKVETEMLALTKGRYEIPTLKIGASVLQNPSNAALLKALGITENITPSHEIVMIGAGPASVSGLFGRWL